MGMTDQKRGPKSISNPLFGAFGATNFEKYPTFDQKLAKLTNFVAFSVPQEKTFNQDTLKWQKTSFLGLLISDPLRIFENQ